VEKVEQVAVTKVVYFKIYLWKKVWIKCENLKNLWKTFCSRKHFKISTGRPQGGIVENHIKFI
jgi:hypothetical protein